MSDDTLHRLYDIMKWGGRPVPIVLRREFYSCARPKVKSDYGRRWHRAMWRRPWQHRSRPSSATTENFFELLPKLFPHADARAWFADTPELAEVTARRNSSLQGAYFMIAARALGLDCGPMSGFDQTKVDHEFFPDSKRVNFGYEYFSGQPHQDQLPVQPRLRRSN
ncbi:nitroreductase family protein [Undibacterium arcticum]